MKCTQEDVICSVVVGIKQGHGHKRSARHVASTGAFPLTPVPFLAGSRDGADAAAPELRNSRLWWKWENKDAVLFPEPPREGTARPSGWWLRSVPGIWQTHGHCCLGLRVPRACLATEWEPHAAGVAHALGGHLLHLLG